MKIIELVIKDNLDLGVDTISIVNQGAIESDFIFLSNQKEEVKLAEVSKEKRLLMGALLIPDKKIYRRNPKTEEEYYIYFSKDTIVEASQLFLKNNNQSSSNLEHNGIPLEGMTLVESWIVEDKNKDKTALYGIDAPVGSWVGTVKVDNDEVWEKFVKTGEVKGFSIEGMFSENVIEEEVVEPELTEEEIKELEIIAELIKLLS